MKKLISSAVVVLIFVIEGFSQHVGIGTNIPEEKLTVFTPSLNYGIIHTDGAISIGTWVGNAAAYFGTKSPHSIRFFTGNGGTQMTLLTSGYFGIGTVAPSQKLHVKQDVANRAIVWEHELQTDQWSLGIGTNTLNCRFEFNGILRGQISSVDGTFISGSDLRLKEQIEPFAAGVLKKTMLLKPSMYFYKDSRGLAKRKSVGFIAQDVETLFPELVYDMDGGYKGLNYAAFGVIAIKAIQEQQKTITDQQKIIASMEERLLKLENALLTLK